MKRFIIFLTSFMMVFSFPVNMAEAEVLAPVPVSSITTVAETKELSIEEAVQLARDSSREMWKLLDALEEIKVSRKQAKDAKELAETIMAMPLEVLSDNKIDITNDYVSKLMAKNGYYIVYADTQTKEVEKNIEKYKIGIEIETKSLYYNALIAEKSIEINKANLNKLNEQLRVITLKYNNGTATKSEVLNGQIAVQKAQTELDSANDDLEMAKLNLLNKINLPFSTVLILKDKSLTYIPTKDLNLTASIEAAKLQRPEILKANNALTLQEIETHVYTAYYTSNLRQNKAAKEKLKDAQLNVPQAYKNVELDVRKNYLKLVESERALVNMNKSVELAKELARINKLLYANGMATSLDVLTAETQLTEAEIGAYQMLVSYNINKMMFDNSNLITAQGQ